MTEEEIELDACPVCLVAFEPTDLCALDVDLGACHAECLEGATIVNLDTGEEMPPDTKVFTVRHDVLTRLAAQP